MFVLLKSELKLAQRSLSDIFNPILFYLLIIILFPLAISPNPLFLQKIAPGIIWIAVLLAILLSLDKLFKHDFEDGTLEQIVLSSYPLPLYIIIKIAAHWLITCLPCILLTPLFALMLHLQSHLILPLIISLLLGTPILCLLGSIVYGLTIGLSNNAFLLALLVTPLYIPVLILGVISNIAAVNHIPYSGDLVMLAAILVLALTLTPFVTASALKTGLMY